MFLNDKLGYIDKDKLQNLEDNLGYNSILVGYRGSIAHDTFVPSTDPNSIDDIDLMGIEYGNLSNYFGLKGFGIKQTNEFWIENLDCVFYEFTHMTRMLSACNPNVICFLWMEDDYYLFQDSLGKWLRQSKRIFLSKNIINSFIGYAKGQSHKANHQSEGGLGYMGQKRKQLFDHLGFDAKNLSHCIRLLLMAKETLNTCDVKVRRTEDRDLLLAIKRGEFSLDEVTVMKDKIIEEIRDTESTTQLPDYDEDFRANLNHIISEIYFDHMIELYRDHLS